ncbi:MAG: CopG family transcriptional regulator [Burkholderiales bacterium]|nr:CopG family transcriptional regulator [Burkholderiales bacterium]
MKNVAVTMQDSVADWARMEAARRHASVSRPGGEWPAEKPRHGDANERALRAALGFRARGASTRPGPGDGERYDRRRPRP